MTGIVETFFRKNPSPGWLCESQTLRFAEVNEAAITRYGLAIDAFQALTLRDLQPGAAPHLVSVRMMRDELLPSQDEILHHHFADGTVLELTLRGVSLEIDGQSYRLVISREIARPSSRSAAKRKLAYIERHAGRIARIGGWRFDTETRTFTYSPAAHAILRLDQDDRGEPSDVIQTISPEDRAAMRGAFDNCADTGERIDRAFTVTDPQGQPRRLRTMAEAEFDLSGKVVGIIGVVQDMTGLRTREDELSAQQALWAASPARLSA